MLHFTEQRRYGSVCRNSCGLDGVHAESARGTGTTKRENRMRERERERERDDSGDTCDLHFNFAAFDEKGGVKASFCSYTLREIRFNDSNALSKPFRGGHVKDLDSRVLFFFSKYRQTSKKGRFSRVKIII